jgi:hypothetical protein
VPGPQSAVLALLCDRVVTGLIREPWWHGKVQSAALYGPVFVSKSRRSAGVRAATPTNQQALRRATHVLLVEYHDFMAALRGWSAKTRIAGLSDSGAAWLPWPGVLRRVSYRERATEWAFGAPVRAVFEGKGRPASVRDSAPYF